jgi:hypothetical protein
MTSINRPNDYVVDRNAPTVVTSYHDQVRWGPILAGLVMALSTQLVLSAFGAAIGMSSIGASGAPRSEAGGVGVNIGIWSIISLLISLFAGGWITSRTAGRMTRNAAMLNGAILWASTLALSAWLLSSGVSGAFGLVASNAGDILNQTQQQNPAVPSPAVTAQQARDIAGNAAKVSWAFVLGSLLGLAAALTGSAVGCRAPRGTTNDAYASPMSGRE